MKGIILAGGSGTRLYPITVATIKQLIPVYDKPMVYYPLATLMLAGVRDILIISTAKDLPRFKELFGTGEQLGINICYEVQNEPRGIAESLIIGEKFLNGDSTYLILGDNIFFGAGLVKLLQDTVTCNDGATIFAYSVADPEKYGVIEFDKNKKVISIEEKPKKPKSNYAATGLYFYDKNASEIAKSITPSARGEIEITALNNEYLKKGKLNVQMMGRGFAWLDTGTYESLLDASNFISTVEKRQGLKIACIEEIAYNFGYIDEKQLRILAEPLKNSGYGEYLLGLLKE